MMKRIQSTGNPLVKQLKKLHTKKEREKTGTYLIEGWHLVEEALKSQVEIITVIMREDEELPQRWDVGNAEIIEATPEVIAAIGDTETPQGIIAVCKMDRKNPPETISTALLIDNVQDPGNVGTLIRTADSAGIDVVILGHGTADLFNSKVIRASQGSMFHLPIIKGDLSEWIDRLKQAELKVFGTALEGAVPYREIQNEERFALIVGNEGRGVAQTLLEKTDQNLYIPIYGKAESLNVSIAAGVLLYHLRG